MTCCLDTIGFTIFHYVCGLLWRFKISVYKSLWFHTVQIFNTFGTLQGPTHGMGSCIGRLGADTMQNWNKQHNILYLTYNYCEILETLPWESCSISFKNICVHFSVDKHAVLIRMTCIYVTFFSHLDTYLYVNNVVLLFFQTVKFKILRLKQMHRSWKLFLAQESGFGKAQNERWLVSAHITPCTTDHCIGNPLQHTPWQDTPENNLKEITH